MLENTDRPERTTTGPSLAVKAPKHLNNFNFIRLALASGVIVSHSEEFQTGKRGHDPINFLFGTGYTLGDLAVNAFFIISGFLIVKSWASQPKAWPYLEKRILRIFPGFIVASLLSEYVFGPMGGNPDYWAHYSPWVVLRRIVTIGLPGEPRAFPDLPIPMVNGALWSIRYEFLCYLGVLVAGCLGVFRYRWLVLIYWVLSTSYHVVQSLSGSMLCPGFTGLLSQLLGPCISTTSMFSAGACFYLFADHVRYTWRGSLIAAVLLLPCLFRHETTAAAFPVFGGYLLMAAAFAPSRALAGFGRYADISYGTYLYGWPIQMLIIHNYRTINPFLLMSLSLLIAYAAGWISWHVVEQPFLRLKPKPRPEQAAIAEAVPLLSQEPVPGA